MHNPQHAPSLEQCNAVISGGVVFTCHDLPSLSRAHSMPHRVVHDWECQWQVAHKATCRFRHATVHHNQLTLL